MKIDENNESRIKPEEAKTESKMKGKKDGKKIEDR